MKIVAELTDGVVLSGEREDVNKILDIMEDSDVSLGIVTKIEVTTEINGKKWWKDADYFSSRKGLLEVVNMDTHHLANAAAKIMRNDTCGFHSIRGNFSGDDLIAVLEDNNALRSLISELAARIEKAEKEALGC